MKKNSLSKIYIYSMGCQRRLLDAKKFINYFKVNGYQVVSNPKKADYILVNTCAFKKMQEDFAIKKVQKFNKYKGKLIVCGCLSDINPQRLKRYFDGPVFTPRTMDKIDEIFNAKIKFRDLPDANHLFKSFLKEQTHFKDYFQLNLRFLRFLIDRVLEKFKGEYYIRISEGCLFKCSYCGIRNALGPLKSKPLNQCLDELKQGISQGYKHFVIIANETGSYGLDIKETFPNLLKKFLEIEGDFNFFIRDIHPYFMIKYLEQLKDLVQTKKIGLIFTSIQSGSNKILKSMNRIYTAEEVKCAVLELKKAYPKLKFRTDVIVGFPGETEEDFNQTLDFIKKVNFDYAAFYPYSERPYATALNFPNKVSPEIIKKRMRKAQKSQFFSSLF